MKRAPILTREGYAERIHAFCFPHRGQRPGIGTHDVLLHHDAALRAAARTKAEERLIRLLQRLGPVYNLCDYEASLIDKAVERVRRERAAKRPAGARRKT